MFTNEGGKSQNYTGASCLQSFKAIIFTKAKIIAMHRRKYHENITLTSSGKLFARLVEKSEPGLCEPWEKRKYYCISTKKET